MDNGIRLKVIEVEYTPGYAYGNVKTLQKRQPIKTGHATGYITSLQAGQKLNEILTPYIPAKQGKCCQYAP